MFHSRNATDALEDSLIIAITNQKGGVGKTTTALNVSAGLALMGYRMLLIDTDPQAHSSSSCLNDSSAYAKSLYDILVHPQDSIETIIAKSTIPGLDVAVSRISMAKLEPALLGEIDGHYRLKDIIQPILPKYDHIVIDTPPTLGLITMNSLVAATHILIPIQSSFLCLEGTDDLLETIDKVKRVANPQLQLLGHPDHPPRQAHQHLAGRRQENPQGLRRPRFQDPDLEKRQARGEPGL